MQMHKDPTWNDQIQMAERRKKDSAERIKQRNAEMREYARNLEAAELDLYQRVPDEHVEARRIWADIEDRRSLTARLMGDPPIERSALRFREAAE